MIQLMVALRIQSACPDVEISNLNMPEWGVCYPKIPCGEPSTTIRLNKVDIAQVSKVLLKGENICINFASYGQHISNYLPVESYRAVFRNDKCPQMGYGENDLVCNIRGDEVLNGIHRNYIQIPVAFYVNLAKETRLRPVFMGQIGNNPYCDDLRRALPDATFVPSQGAKADFQAIRNSVNIVLSVSTFSWLAAWLSEARNIFLPVAGLFHPVQSPATDFLPLRDERFRFYLFPISYAVPMDRMSDAHRAVQGMWRYMRPEALGELIHALPRYPRRLDRHLQIFSEKGYLAVHPDVARAVANGSFNSGLHHYTAAGFDEFRDPTPFNRTWYATQYSLAAFEAGQGDYIDLLHHFADVGRARGHTPLAPDGAADDCSIGMELRQAYDPLSPQ